MLVSVGSADKVEEQIEHHKINPAILIDGLLN